MNCWVKNGQKVVKPSKNASYKKIKNCSSKCVVLWKSKPMMTYYSHLNPKTSRLIILFINLTRNSSKSQKKSVSWALISTVCESGFQDVFVVVDLPSWMMIDTLCSGLSLHCLMIPFLGLASRSEDLVLFCILPIHQTMQIFNHCHFSNFNFLTHHRPGLEAGEVFWRRPASP